MKLIICALAALLLTFTLSGCGQSGPLYVPGDPSSIKVPVEPVDADEETDENGEDADSP